MNIAKKLLTIASQMQPTYEEAKNSYEKGYKDGENNKSFWNLYQDNGNRRNYDYAFAGSGWTDEVYNPKYPIIVLESCEDVFNGSQVTDVKVPIILGEGIEGFFFANSSVKNIPSIETESEYLDWLCVFEKAKYLEHIGFNGVINGEFYLQESPNLDDETLISLVHALYSEGGWGLNLHSEVTNRLSTILMDDRSPEYEGMSLEDVINEKGWYY